MRFVSAPPFNPYLYWLLLLSVAILSGIIAAQFMDWFYTFLITIYSPFLVIWPTNLILRHSNAPNSTRDAWKLLAGRFGVPMRKSRDEVGIRGYSTFSDRAYRCLVVCEAEGLMIHLDAVDFDDNHIRVPWLSLRRLECAWRSSPTCKGVGRDAIRT
ncbi:MAG: hypothetical protein HC809_00515 [Gammaproteobacteria bacterium]|nr:hypothetical protein [Gammaproteobacteria bacterium]